MSSPVSQRKLKFIGCEIIYREACFLAASAPAQVDVEFLRKGLHDLETGDMLAKVQGTIDAVDPGEGYEAILLGYARCNDGLVGIQARTLPLIIPRAHDCITFFFGSRAAFKAHFDENPGTYYLTTGWMERGTGLSAREGTGRADYVRPAYGKQGVMAKMGLADSYEEMVAKYGKDNADFLSGMLGDWMKNYSRFLYLSMSVCDETRFLEAAKKEADERAWKLDVRPGDLSLLRKLFFGPWDDDFVIVPPGGRVIAMNDQKVLDFDMPEKSSAAASS